MNKHLYRLALLGGLSACANQSATRDHSKQCAPYLSPQTLTAHAPGADIYCKARIAQRLEENEKALALFRKAALKKNTSAECFVVALESETKSATTALDALLLLSPNDSACLMLRAREAIFTGALEEGIRFAKASTKNGSGDPNVWATLGFAYFRKQDYVLAGESFEKSVAIDQDIPQNIFNIGYAYYLGGEYTRARRWLVKAQGITALDTDLKSRAQKSIKIIDGAIWICPMHPAVTGTKGDICPKCKMNLEPVSRGVGSDGE